MFLKEVITWLNTALRSCCSLLQVLIYYIFMQLYRLRDNIYNSKTTVLLHSRFVFSNIFFTRWKNKKTFIKYLLENTGSRCHDQIRTLKTLLRTFSKICHLWNPVPIIQILSAISAISLTRLRIIHAHTVTCNNNNLLCVVAVYVEEYFLLLLLLLNNSKWRPPPPTFDLSYFLLYRIHVYIYFFSTNPSGC